VVSLVDVVAELFAAYGRDASEENLRAYVAVLKHGNEAAVQRAIIEAARGGNEKLPTAAQIMKRANEICKNDDEEGQRQKNRWNQIVTSYYQKAVAAGWSLAQRDELMDVCETAFDQRTGAWRWSEQRLADEVKKLVEAVNAFRDAVRQADDKGEPRPDEVRQRWGWALPKPDKLEWDPAKESLWDHVKKLF
jgi:hypothetical protein